MYYVYYISAVQDCNIGKSFAENCNMSCGFFRIGGCCFIAQNYHHSKYIGSKNWNK